MIFQHIWIILPSQQPRRVYECRHQGRPTEGRGRIWARNQRWIYGRGGSSGWEAEGDRTKDDWTYHEWGDVIIRFEVRGGSYVEGGVDQAADLWTGRKAVDKWLKGIEPKMIELIMNEVML